MRQVRRQGFAANGLQGTAVGSGQVTAARPGGQGRLLAVVDSDRCICCWMCVDLCPEAAITMKDVAQIDPARCSACGACVQDCPNDAVSLVEANQQSAR